MRIWRAPPKNCTGNKQNYLEKRSGIFLVEALLEMGLCFAIATSEISSPNGISKWLILETKLQISQNEAPSMARH